MKVFTAYFTKEDGTRVYARNHGKRCFVFEADGRTRKSRARAASKAKRSGKTKYWNLTSQGSRNAAGTL